MAARNTSLDKTTVFYASSYGEFIEIQSNFRRKKLHRTNQGSFFLEAVLAIEIMQEPQPDLEEKDKSSILQDDFPSRTYQSIFASIALVSLDWSNETN